MGRVEAEPGGPNPTSPAERWARRLAGARVTDWAWDRGRPFEGAGADALPVVEALLLDPDAAVRAHATYGLGLMCQTGPVPDLPWLLALRARGGRLDPRTLHWLDSEIGFRRHNNGGWRRGPA